MVIFCGLFHTLVMDNSNVVRGFGFNNNSQLGDNKIKSQSRIPKEITTFTVPIHSIACGDYHTICLDIDGYVWGFGKNIKGQLGLGDVYTRFSPSKIKTLSEITSIACGWSNTFCINAKGNVYAFGDNSCSNLGLGIEDKQKSIPTLSSQVNDIISVSASAGHTLFNDKEGKVYGVGMNEHIHYDNRIVIKDVIEIKLELDDGEMVIHMDCAEYYSAFVTNQGKIFACGQQSSLFKNKQGRFQSPSLIEDAPQNITNLSAGENTLAVIDSDGNLYFKGQEIGTKQQNDVNFTKCDSFEGVVAANFKFNRAFVATVDCNWVCGENSRGQLGIGSSEVNIPQFIKVPEEYNSYFGTSSIPTKPKSARK